MKQFLWSIKSCEDKVTCVNSKGCEDTQLLYYKSHTTNLRTLKKGNTATAITYYEGMLYIHCAKKKKYDSTPYWKAPDWTRPRSVLEV